jgi:DNA excision repair protein ERCC-2
MEITSQFDKRKDPSVISNFGKLLVELSGVVPDGMVCFFTRFDKPGAVFSS